MPWLAAVLAVVGVAAAALLVLRAWYGRGEGRGREGAD